MQKIQAHDDAHGILSALDVGQPLSYYHGTLHGTGGSVQMARNADGTVRRTLYSKVCQHSDDMPLSEAARSLFHERRWFNASLKAQQRG